MEGRQEVLGRQFEQSAKAGILTADTRPESWLGGGEGQITGIPADTAVQLRLETIRLKWHIFPVVNF